MHLDSPRQDRISIQAAVAIVPPWLETMMELLAGDLASLRAFNSISSVMEALNPARHIHDGVTATVAALLGAVNALPDASEKDSAVEFLVAASERLDVYRDSSRLEQAAGYEFETASTIFGSYEEVHETSLNYICGDIQDLFADYYRIVNADDESHFLAQLTPDASGLDMTVDFYNRGKFPPGAYHSEGHQDGMGLCLYLALMKHLYGDDFKLCVLDDVLMSVDRSHRRAVCTLLREQLPETRFVFTTHDEVWLKNMQTSGLITRGNFIHFRKWDIGRGPADWRPDDVFDEITEYLHNNKVRSASATLRHYLEFFAGELCHTLQARVVYRGDNRHDLGDLLPQAIGRYKELLKEGKAAANSWNQRYEINALNKREKIFNDALVKALGEQWAVNPTIHFNAWADLGKRDFEPVVAAYQVLLPLFSCSVCNGLFYVIPVHGKDETLRCTCGKTNINLKKKKP